MKPFTQEAPLNAPQYAPRLELIAGHEYEKRAVEIALIGNHPIVFLINKGSEIPSLLMTANRIAFEQQIKFKGLAYFWCPCGNYGNTGSPMNECRCEIPAIVKHLGKLAKEIGKNGYDIWCQSNVYPRQYHLGQVGVAGEVEEVFVERVIRARGKWIETKRMLKKSGNREPLIPQDSPLNEPIRHYQRSVSDKLDVERVMRLARTIACSDHQTIIQKHHVQEALQYQPYSNGGLMGVLGM